jgi:hypothetical protein
MGFLLCRRGPGWVLVGALALISCGNIKRHEPKQASSQDLRLELLREELRAKRGELALASDPDSGWPSATDCDALLWAGLAAAAGAPTRLALAEYSPGELHRRPRPPCWDGEDRGSKSSISRDMLTGYLWGVWRARDVGAAQRLAAYGEAHDWVMGGGDRARTDLRGNLKGLLGRMLHALGGGSPEYRFLPSFYLPGGKDYERHLAVLGILLQGEVAGAIGTDLLAVLKINAEGSAEDALFQAARGVYTGDQSAALDLLLNTDYVAPSYVRHAPAYRLVHWIFAADTVVRSFDL